MATGTYYPALSYISGITNSQQATVTFTAPHDFTAGEYISLRSSQPYGMFQVNNARTRVLSFNTTQVTTDLNTLFFDAFVYPPVGQVIYPAIAVPAGSGIIPDPSNTAYPTALPQTNLEDSFDNIPPM